MQRRIQQLFKHLRWNILCNFAERFILDVWQISEYGSGSNFPNWYFRKLMTVNEFIFRRLKGGACRFVKNVFFFWQVLNYFAKLSVNSRKYLLYMNSSKLLLKLKWMSSAKLQVVGWVFYQRWTEESCNPGTWSSL